MPFFESQEAARARVKRENAEKQRKMDEIKKLREGGEYVAKLAKAASGHEATGAEQRKAEAELTRAFGKAGAKKQIKKHMERAGARSGIRRFFS